MKLGSCGSTIAALMIVANLALALALAAESKDASDKVDETDTKRASWQEVKRDEQTAESAALTQTNDDNNDNDNNNDSNTEDVEKKASWMDVKKASWMDVKKKASWMDVKKKASWMDVKKRASWMDVKRDNDNAQNQDEQIQRLIELLQSSATA